MFHLELGRTVPSIAAHTFCKLSTGHWQIVRFSAADGSLRCRLWVRLHILLAAVRSRWGLVLSGWVLAMIHSASWRLHGQCVHSCDRWGRRRGLHPQADRCCGRLPWQMLRRVSSRTRAPLAVPGMAMMILPRLNARCLAVVGEG